MFRDRASALVALLAASLVLSCDEGDGDVEPDEARALPEVSYCDPARDWDEEHAQLEARVLARIEAHRAAGADCGDHGRFLPSGALHEDGTLRCAARVHARDMAEREFFAHENPDDETTADRVALAGGRFSTLSQAIASGEATPEQVVDAIWIGSAGSCATLVGDAFAFVGVGGFVDEAGLGWWTVVFAR